MSDIQQELSGSPTRVANFIIPFTTNISFNKEDTDRLLSYVQANSNFELTATDSAFFPRAFTDTDIEVDNLVPVENFNRSQTTNSKTMESTGGSFIQAAFQPDVVMTSSFQRSGPDGSPSLVPAAAQRPHNLGNTSETGELFAPARVLNFSEMDQSSQIEDNYSEQGRYFSTQEHGDKAVKKFRQVSDSQLSTEQAAHLQRHTGNSHFQLYISHQSEREALSPEFRPLEADGEADGQLSGTGTLQPSAMGLNSDFSKGNASLIGIRQGYGDSVFSPLSSTRPRSEESVTPPLHSPDVSRQLNDSSQGQPIASCPQNINFSGKTDHELQFSMSPSKVQNDHDARNLSKDSIEDVQEISPVLFQQKYLQKTQVSVTLPTATYDSLADEADANAAEKYLNYPAGSSAWPQYQQASPERVIGVIRNQVSSLREAENTGMCSNRSSRENVLMSNVHVDENCSQRSVNASKDRGIELADQRPGEHSGSESDNGNTNNTTSGARRKDNQTSNVSNHVPGGEHEEDKDNSTKTSHETSRSPTTQERNHKPVTSKPATKFQSILQPVTSRVLQETASQKSKVSSKFVASNAKAIAPLQQNKEVKKLHDVQANRGPAVGGNVSKSVSVGSLPQKRTVVGISDADAKSTRTRLQTSSGMTDQTSFKPRVVPNSADQKSKQQAGSQSYLKSRNSTGNTTGMAQTRNSAQAALDRRTVQQGLSSRTSNTDEDEDGDVPDKAVVTQIEQTSPAPVENPLSRSSQHEQNQDVQGMEEVRGHLQGMLRMSTADSVLSATERSQYEHSDIIAGHEVGYQGYLDPSLRMENRLAGLGLEYGQPDTSWPIYNQHEADVSEISEKFPTFSSQFVQSDSGNVSRSDISLQTENQRLRDILEKERYRRQHCEQYIQQLNVKLLETQQQVAVAVSTDKRKDLMIEQLDKQLAKVVEGWKKRDVDKEVFIKQLKREKEDIMIKTKQQEQIVGQFERDMSEAVEALRMEKESSAESMAEQKEQLDEVMRKKGHSEEVLEAEREKVQLIQQECNHLRETREQLDKKLDQMQRKLHREQDDWFQREQELLQKIEEVSENNSNILQMEKSKNEEQRKLAEEMLEKLQMYTTKTKKMEMELDAAQREKESLKVEMGIMEAKFESSQRVLEADLHSMMEKQASEQVAEVQAKMERVQDELREKHREQMLEFSQKHGREIETHLAQFRDELHNKEDEVRKQIQEMETRLQEYRNENTALKQAKQKLESQRLEILTKLQYMMQSQWNEALSLLSATPKRTPAAASRISLRSEEGQTSHTEQPVPVVNFNLQSPYRPPTSGAAHDAVSVYSPGQDSVISHSTAKDGYQGHSHHGNLPLDDIEAVETSAALHVKELQDYINSVTETPDWISSMNTQQESAVAGQPVSDHQSHMDLASLLSSHMQKLRKSSNQHQPPLVPLQPMSVSESRSFTLSYLNPAHQNAVFTQAPSSSQSSLKMVASSAVSRTEHLDPISSVRQENNESYAVRPAMFSGAGDGLPWENQTHNESHLSEISHISQVSHISQAVPIRPPQQLTGLNSYQHMSSDVDKQGSGYFQGGQSFSPPTKQSNAQRPQQGHRISRSPPDNEDNHNIPSVMDESDRLNEDYSHLSERLEQHESHQNDLQHYIQLLLNRAPGDQVPHNDSMYSADQLGEELDLNDTAQAAQLQRELDRIQELRQKQESGQKQAREPVHSHQEEDTSMNQSKAGVQDKILNASQMADISRLLQQVKGQREMENPQMSELLDVLKHWENGTPSPAGKDRRSKQHSHYKSSPKSERNKELASVKKNLQFQSNMASSEGSDKTKETPGHKGGTSKKMERKIAGGSGKADGKSGKAPAWK